MKCSWETHFRPTALSPDFVDGFSNFGLPSTISPDFVDGLSNFRLPSTILSLFVDSFSHFGLSSTISPVFVDGPLAFRPPVHDFARFRGRPSSHSRLPSTILSLFVDGLSNFRLPSTISPVFVDGPRVKGTVRTECRGRSSGCAVSAGLTRYICNAALLRCGFSALESAGPVVCSHIRCLRIG